MPPPQVTSDFSVLYALAQAFCDSKFGTKSAVELFVPKPKSEQGSIGSLRRSSVVAHRVRELLPDFGHPTSVAASSFERAHASAHLPNFRAHATRELRFSGKPLRPQAFLLQIVIK